jgi:opacity protein-like surface antigen
MSARCKAVVISLALCAVMGQANAGEWKQEIAPYLWGSGMSGTTGVGDVAAETNKSFSDILNNLEFGFMGAYRATKDRYSIMFDALHFGLGATQRGPNGILKSDVDMDQLGLEVDVGYALSDRFTIFGGLRFTDLEAKVKITSSGPLGGEVSAKQKQSWVDPVIGAYYTWPLSDNWSTTLRGDIGGFGVGSDFAWQGIATLRWQASPRTGVVVAYRYVDVDYENGKGDDYFKYDMAVSGPAMGVVFTF